MVWFGLNGLVGDGWGLMNHGIKLVDVGKLEHEEHVAYYI